MFMQGDWSKSDTGSTVFTGQTISCSECSPIEGNHYSYRQRRHSEEVCHCNERVVTLQTLEFKFDTYQGEISQVRRQDSLSFSGKFKNVGRKSFVIAKVSDVRKSRLSDVEKDLIEEKGKRFQICGKDFHECTENHMH